MDPLFHRKENGWALGDLVFWEDSRKIKDDNIFFGQNSAIPTIVNTIDVAWSDTPTRLIETYILDISWRKRLVDVVFIM